MRILVEQFGDAPTRWCVYIQYAGLGCGETGVSALARTPTHHELGGYNLHFIVCWDFIPMKRTFSFTFVVRQNG